MSLTSCLLFVAAATAPQVEVSTLQGQSQKGTLQRLTATTLTLRKATGVVNIPVSQLLSVAFPNAVKPKAAAKAVIPVTLRDGTRFDCTQVNTTARTAILSTASFGTLKLPLAAVAHIRFAAPNSKLDAKWKAFTARKIKKDYLVIPKETTLDHLDGVVGKISDTAVKFTLRKNELELDRSRIFGVIYFAGTAKPPRGKTRCQAVLSSGEFLQLASIRFDGDKLTGVLRCGSTVVIPTTSLKTLDFSLGKIVYLSSMEPRDVEYTPFIHDPSGFFRYRRDRNLEGMPLNLGGRKYTRGLWIYSRTKLRYRLGREFRSFKAVMGIDFDRPHGDVHVIISGDGKILLETDVRGGDKPKVLDLPVSGVLMLEIFVDYGRGNDQGDHLELAEARVIK
ncbi:MAG: NPCBM/NEW2 domain-containing protein [Planctomycetes bacterium]|nr:NPCBM/NEW2 domain-containing protein [Planctomycetota bacterium]